jgi:hypothetical protein
MAIDRSVSPLPARGTFPASALCGAAVAQLITKETKMTDLRLNEGGDGTFIVLDGRVVKATASDFMLDSPERRSGKAVFRRALVHDQGDGLTVNFANDYNGGVTLNGVRELSPLHLPHDSKSVKVLDPTPVLVVRGGIQFEVHSETPLSVGGDGGGVKVTTLSLHGELTRLQNQIAALETKLAALASHR